MLNLLWLLFFVTAFVSALAQWIFFDESAIFAAVVEAMLSMASTSVDIALGLVGVLAFWLGMMKIAEAAGVIGWLSRALTPVFTRLMPELPGQHPAIGSITMNLTANMLGLDNAATPLGLKAMKDLQTLNPKPDTASNAQILFLVLNTSSVTLFPMAIFFYRLQQGAANPTDVFVPILMATSASTLVGLATVAWIQRLPWRDSVLLAHVAGFFAVAGSLVAYLLTLSVNELQQQSALIANLLLLLLIMTFLLVAHRRGVAVYDTFISGAKEGFGLAVNLIPYLLAMLVAIAALRASGALDYVLSLVAQGAGWFGWDTRFVDALPTALMKPFSGSGARAMMLESMQTYGVDSFAGRLSSVFQGSTETTFYVLAVYFGAVGIRHSRHAIGCGLAADLAGIVAAIFVSYWFFG